MIIVLEGLPASGKTTVANYLQKNFNFCKVNESLGFLGGNNLSDDQLFIFRETVKKYKLAKKTKKDTIIDRGYVSMLAWDYCSVCLKKYYKFSNKNNWVKRAIACGELYEPDVYIYLIISPEVSLTRRPREESEKDIWTSVLGLKYCADYYNNFFYNKKNKTHTIFINAEMSFDDVISEIIIKLNI